MSKIKEVRANVEIGKPKLVPGLVEEALDEGNAPLDILDAMVEAMGVVGEKISSGQFFVPEMLIAAKAMSNGIAVLKPYLSGDASSSLGTCVIGTVQGDLHDIGKKLVAMMIESAGFRVVDLGVDVPAEKFITAVKEDKAVKLVACSGLLTTTMPAMKNTVTALKECGIGGFKILVGGATVTREFAAEIGADGYAPDAGRAAVIAKELVAGA